MQADVSDASGEEENKHEQYIGFDLDAVLSASLTTSSRACRRREEQARTTEWIWSVYLMPYLAWVWLGAWCCVEEGVPIENHRGGCWSDGKSVQNAFSGGRMFFYAPIFFGGPGNSDLRRKLPRFVVLELLICCAQVEKLLHACSLSSLCELRGYGQDMILN
jgi:hypothetical protein